MEVVAHDKADLGYVTFAHASERPHQVNHLMVASQPVQHILAATLAIDGQTLDLPAWVLIMPESLNYSLFGSLKSASQNKLGPDETLTYTIHLHNSGTISVTATVTDPIPAEMNMVAGSAGASGGVFDAGTDTVTWTDIEVPPGESIKLSFAVFYDLPHHTFPRPTFWCEFERLGS